MSGVTFATASLKGGEAKRNSPLSSALRVGAPGDAYEREADRVADAVMSGRRAGWSLASLPVDAPLPRKCDCGSQAAGRCEACKNDENLRRKPHGSGGPQIAPASVDATLRSPGRPLEHATRSLFEARFGVDFGTVRIHADDAALRSTREVNARAYTVGDHVVLGAGVDSAPRDYEGQRLLAHELAHTLQRQRSRLSRQLSDPDKLHVPDRPLRPHVPVGPSFRIAPLCSKANLAGLDCGQPVKGSASDFVSKNIHKGGQSAPKKPRTAAETKKAAETARPGALGGIFQVVIDPSASENIIAYVTTCEKVHVATTDPSARCMGVPEHLEKEAALFNKGKECLSDRDICYPDRESWAHELLQTAVHESAHIAFERHRPAEISTATRAADQDSKIKSEGTKAGHNKAVTLFELSELYAQFSEFPLFYENTFQNQYMKPENKSSALNIWVDDHVESDKQGIRGMLTKLRCVNTCEKADMLVLAMMRSVTAKWPSAVHDALLTRLVAIPNLDWPQAPSRARSPRPP